MHYLNKNSLLQRAALRHWKLMNSWATAMSLRLIFNCDVIVGWHEKFYAFGFCSRLHESMGIISLYFRTVKKYLARICLYQINDRWMKGTVRLGLPCWAWTSHERFNQNRWKSYQWWGEGWLPIRCHTYMYGLKICVGGSNLKIWSQYYPTFFGSRWVSLQCFHPSPPIGSEKLIL